MATTGESTVHLGIRKVMKEGRLQIGLLHASEDTKSMKKSSKEESQLWVQPGKSDVFVSTPSQKKGGLSIIPT